MELLTWEAFKAEILEEIQDCGILITKKRIKTYSILTVNY